MIAPAAAAAPTTGSAPSAAARSLADADGFDEILRDGLTLLHQRETMATTPVIGKGPTRSDFDGDGRDDIATTADGGVTITYSSAPHRDLLRTVMPGNGCVCFGMQLVGGDFNGDNYDDLAISDYDEVDLNEMGYHAGAVWIFSGGPDGLRVKTVKHINQSTAGVPGASLEPDRFGRALAAGDITGDGRDDLAVGIPGKRIGRAKEAGAVLVLKGSATGITAAGARLITQHTGGVPGTPESGDAFGRSVAVGKINKDKYRDLIVGAPAEDEYAGDGSGLITQFWGSASGVSLSKVSKVSGNAATHAADREGTHLWYLGSALAVTDTDGDGYGEVIVGVGRAQAGSGWEVQPGAVVSFAGRGTGLATKGLKVFSQDSAGIADSTESDDYFGDTVAVGDVTGDGLGDVLVGVPGEDVGKAVDAGMVVLLRGTRSGLTGAGSQSLTQNSSTVPDAAENGDEFGLSTAVLNLDGTGRLHALVGAPHERLQGDAGITPAGTITRFSGGPDGLRAGTATSGLDRWGE
ncbi:MAG TPA: FG-GAP and VCBS repeat-containing protein, partial [Actinoplanes sp.]|nr:FG-GAP and VCBS repeat-containing protein [Actinoplanes sp.]